MRFTCSCRIWNACFTAILTSKTTTCDNGHIQIEPASSHLNKLPHKQLPEKGNAFKPCLSPEATHMQCVLTRKRLYDDERPLNLHLILLELVPTSYPINEHKCLSILITYHNNFWPDSFTKSTSTFEKRTAKRQKLNKGLM